MGTTELFVNEAAAWRALQGGTLVMPGTAATGSASPSSWSTCGRAGRVPRCRYVFTAVAGVNAAMNAVNDALGFRGVERLLEMQLRL